MERLKNMKESLMNAAQAQINGNLDCVDTEELGDVIDMIKDLEEAIYYKTITEAMGENKEKEQHRETVYYTEKIYPPYMPYPMNPIEPTYRDMDRDYGRMYYDGRGGNGGRGGNNRGIMYADGQGGGSGSGGGSNSGGGNSGGNSGGSARFQQRMMPDYEYEYPQELLRDRREGQSPKMRKNYMEAKEMHQGKEVQMKELEKYLQELSQDVTEMIQDATPEEKQMLQQKLSLLVTKIK